MNTKVKIILAVFTMAITFSAVQAQRGMDRQMTPQKHGASISSKLAEKLALTEEQQAELKKINETFIEKMKAQKEEHSWEKMKVLRVEHHAAIATILTPEQKEKFEAQRPERAGMQGRRGGHGQFHKANAENRKAMQKERQGYVKENIHPVIVEQRAKLEAKISATDKKAIAELREKIQASKKERITERKSQMRGFKYGKGQNGKANHRGHQGKGSPLLDEVSRQRAESLVKAYSNDIESLFDDITPQREQWKNDLKAIHENYRKENSEKRGMGRMEGKTPSEEKLARRDFQKKLRFLLMPAEMKSPKSSAKEERLIAVFPNPAGNIQNIEFEVVTAGSVKVDIVDQQGNVVKSVYKGELPKGLNKLEVNIGELKSNMYYYRITDAQGTTSKPFFVR